MKGVGEEEGVRDKEGKRQRERNEKEGFLPGPEACGLLCDSWWLQEAVQR